MKNENILLGILAGLVLLDRGRAAVPGLGAIVDEAPTRGGSSCFDGKFSTYGPRHKGGVCSYHGGRIVVNKISPLQSIVSEVNKIYQTGKNESQLDKLTGEMMKIYFDEKGISVNKTNVKAQGRKYPEIAKELGLIAPAAIQIGLDNIRPAPELSTLLKQLENIKNRIRERIRLGRNQGGSAGAFNRDVANLQHTKDLILRDIKRFYPNYTGIGGFIGAIFPTIPGEWYECNDGTFSTSGSPYGCSWHGGLKTGEPIPTGGGAQSSALLIQDVPLTQINTRPEWFQNRADAYSTRSVENIVSAVLENRFVWSNFDPIQLWKADDGKLYILSGHSRKEAFKRLADMGASYDGRTFDSIPAKIETGLTLEQAQQVARESNTLGTPETVLERAAYYRRLRQTGNTTLRQLDEAAKRTEGRNAATVLALSFLNTGGKTYRALEALQAGDETSRGNLENIARWIGNARKSFPMLTDAHENEIYDWLVTGGGYGTSRGQISSERDFKAELQKIIFKRTEFGVFNQDEPLNILNSRYTSPVEAEYNRQLSEKQAEIRELEKEQKEKTRRYASASREDFRRIMQPVEAALRIKRQELQNLLLKKNDVLDAAKNQTSLFGFRRIYRRTA